LNAIRHLPASSRPFHPPANKGKDEGRRMKHGRRAENSVTPSLLHNRASARCPPNSVLIS
jgi:hypothetical protein